MDKKLICYEGRLIVKMTSGKYREITKWYTNPETKQIEKIIESRIIDKEEKDKILRGIKS